MLVVIKCTEYRVSQKTGSFLPERDYDTFGYMPSQIRLSFVCLSSVTFVRPIQPVEIFGNVFWHFVP